MSSNTLFKQSYAQPTLTRRKLPYTLHQGDCIAVMRTLPENSIDAIVTDPPCGIAFMGTEWDKDKGGRKQWIAWLSEVMREALRCLKPGGHAFVWALPRTSHWTATALEDAGFEIRDVITHLFGSGFPKSMDISKAIDKMHGAEREVTNYVDGRGTYDGSHRVPREKFTGNVWNNGEAGGTTLAPITAPATPDAMRYAGYGTNLKPASENWILCRKPLSEPTIAANVLKHGTGGLNIDKSRIGTQDNLNGGAYSQSPREDGKSTNKVYGLYERLPEQYKQPQGRFPSNLLISHTLECQRVGTHKVHVNDKAHIRYNHAGNQGYHGNVNDFEGHGYADSEGMETVEAWHCSELCPVRLLDEQSGKRKHGGPIQYNGVGMFHGNKTDASTAQYQDEGGASRYFLNLAPTPDDYPPFYYCSKSSRKERNAGCEGLPEGYNDFQRESSGLNQDRPNREGRKPATPAANNHPTVKSLSLMKYLCTMITPENGVILDPFMGSGSTGVAAIAQGFQFVGIEQEAAYLAIAEARVAHAAMEVTV